MIRKKKKKEEIQEPKKTIRKKKWFICVLNSEGFSKEIKGAYSTERIKKIVNRLKNREDLLVWGSGMPQWISFFKVDLKDIKEYVQ